MHIFTYIIYILTDTWLGCYTHCSYKIIFNHLSFIFPINELANIDNNKNHEEYHHKTFIFDKLFGKL